MKVTFCDKCRQVIKPTQQKYILALLPVIENQEGLNIEALLDMIKLQYEAKYKSDQIKVEEICEECKKVVDYFFDVRIEELQVVKHTLNKIKKQFEFKEPEGNK